MMDFPPGFSDLQPYIEPATWSLLIVIGAIVTLAVARKLRLDVVRAFYEQRLALGQSRRLNRYTGFINTLIQFAVAFGAFTGFARIWWPKIFAHVEKDVWPLFTAGTRFVLILFMFVVMWELVYFFMHRAIYRHHEGSKQRAETLFPFAMNVVGIFLALICVFMLLREMGIDVMPLVTGAGIAGVALGLGAQNSIRDLISGFTIIMEDLIQVGDVVRIGAHSGTVEQLTLRKIQLRDMAGTVITVPYSEVKVIENLTKQFSYFVTSVPFAADADPDQARAVLEKIGAAMQADRQTGEWMLDALEVLGVDAFVDAGYAIKLRIKTQPGKQWAVGRDFNRRLKPALDAARLVGPAPIRHVRVLDDAAIPSETKKKVASAD